MIRKICVMTINSHTLVFFFLVQSLLFLCVGPNSSILDTLGGFTATGSVDVLGTIRWNFCILPPVLVSTVFFAREIGSMYIFTLLRVKSVSQWCRAHFCAIYFINIVYFFATLCYGFVYTFHPHYSLRELLLFGMEFTFHTTMVSFLPIFSRIFIKSVHASLVTFLFVEGFGVVVGSVIPKASPYLLGYWGMANNANYLFDSESKHFAFTQGFTFAFTVILASIAIAYLKKHDPKEE